MQLGAIITQALRNQGVQELFGIPGDFILPFLQQMQDQTNALPFYYMTHEPAVVYAADAAARAANRPTAVALTYGAGALNGVNAIAQAYEEYVPLVILAGYPSQKEINSGLQIHHQAKSIDSQRAIFSEITCAQVRLDNPDTAIENLQFALQMCRQKSRPVLIEIPRDATNFNLPAMPNQSIELANPPIHENQYRQLTTALTTARRPVILSGIKVRRSGAQRALERLAEQFNIPVVTTLLGRATVSPSHSCYAGVFCGDTQTRASQLLYDADLIIAFGVVYTDSNFSAHRELINAAHFYRIDFPTQSLKAWCARLASEPLPLFETRDISPIAVLPSSNFNADSVVQAMHQQLSQQRALVPLISDVGDCLFASLQASPTDFLAPAYYASMGYSVPAALGVFVATRRRPIILVGDGAFLMTGLELGHCLRYGCKPIVVLLNNHKWDMIAAFAPTLQCTALQQWHYPELAKAMGIESLRAHNAESFSESFAKAWADHDNAYLIDVWLPENSRTKRLSDFAETLTTINKSSVSKV
ncbi:thiamine pyrophosphate-binding protein [Pseudidiomarina woesei]|uniref:TPP-dependent 2-oxoacid decarboxylase, includes indolepyruvate decarboxylase n=1 Tax=Pseudidiomarina woesei TaxID=1381080 RepID=A0A0K6H677_9GAMM|nr:thiamine pyrophosphate-binding protein [Pseudidiomarina woesei]CUA86226.1 TPP-dependent 2-oxoacid decarboxylase, includes indolepyruvate decarboxylase [Pseudidiomarina woesei]